MKLKINDTRLSQWTFLLRSMVTWPHTSTNSTAALWGPDTLILVSPEEEGPTIARHLHCPWWNWPLTGFSRREHVVPDGGCDKRRFQCSDDFWHFSEPVFTILALFEMVWPGTENIGCFYLPVLIGSKKRYLLFGSKKIWDLVNKLRNLALFNWEFGTKSLSGPDITGFSNCGLFWKGLYCTFELKSSYHCCHVWILHTLVVVG